ncbi:MAG: lamin tail domain-containing protein, partial [Nocardioides sp.]
VRLYADSDLVNPVDSYTYPAHPPAGRSYGRCPDGTGAFVVTAAATQGAANRCAVPDGGESIKINEVQSDPSDLVELTNIAETAVDISGYVLKDNDDTHVFTVPAGTTVASKGYVVLDVDVSFGLGKGDSVRLYDPSQANLLDATTYPADTHATNWGRCPNGTGEFGVVTDTLGWANDCAGEPSGTPDVVINEVESNGDQVADWVEIKNRSASPVNVSGWKILDGDPSHAATPVVVPAGTIIAAGGHYAIYTEIAQSPGFGLGVGDSVTLLLADGTTQVDTTTWGAHAATTWGRCPDGTGDFRETTASTRSLPNACSPIRINEVESSGGTPGDWVELVNISADPVEVGGLVVKDNDDAHAYAIPASTSIAGKGYLVIEESDLGFGLGGADAVRLFDADGTTLIEQYDWTSAATQTYARCKDGLGDFVDSKAPTKGAANSCPGLETAPWPGAQTVSTADLADTFVQDLSGLAFDPADPDVLWAAQNKLGTLFKLTRDADDTFVPADGWPKNPVYTDGTGAPDTEGIAIGPDGFVYLASERNNAASGVSRMSILRYDPSATGATIAATDEWDLTSQIPAAGANLGLEGIAFVPDSYLTAGGFTDQSTDAAYDPADYPLHGTGLYFVAIEDTGDLIAFALDSDGSTSHKIATIDSGFAHLADVSFDPELQRVWAVTDDTHDGRSSLLKIDDSGSFVVDAAYDRPVGMPNLNNEGMAIAPQSRCVDGEKEVLWSDDGDTDGHSLRRGTIDCTPLPLAQQVEFTSDPPEAPVVGQTWTVTTSGGGSGNPVELSVTSPSICTLQGAVVRFEHVGTCEVRADQAGDPSHEAGQAQRSVGVGQAATTTTVTTGRDRQQAAVAAVAPGGGRPTGTVSFAAGDTMLGRAPLVDGVATLGRELPVGATELTATYSGSADFIGSDGSATAPPVVAPTISASLDPKRPKSGWWSSKVTVTFECEVGSVPLTASCPSPVVLSRSRADQSVTRTITAVDGGTASVTVEDIDIDRSGPVVHVRGVRNGATYQRGAVPKARCQARDALSGVDSCKLSRKVSPTRQGKRVAVTARAVDEAGNVTTDRVRYRVANR